MFAKYQIRGVKYIREYFLKKKQFYAREIQMICIEKSSHSRYEKNLSEN